MAKGDYVSIITTGGNGTSITASRRGRKLVTRTVTRAKVQWLEIEEVTQRGRPTGTRLTARLDQLAYYSTYTKEERDVEPRKVVRVRLEGPQSGA